LTGWGRARSPFAMPSIPRPVRRAGTLAALVATPIALAYRFALVYRIRAGFARRVPPRLTPADRGLPFELTTVPSTGGRLPAWFIPARGGAPGPGVVLVHGWESNRDRTLPNAQVLHAAGFHVLTFDVRGHGANPPETLPISVGEFRDDAAAALSVLLDRPEVTRGALLGHSLGAVGAALAAADAGDRCAALVASATPADPRRLTRQTFRLARLPIPEPFATPLAALTSRIYVRPRGHIVADLSASRAVARYAGPILLIHGAEDSVVPAAHMSHLERAARRGRRARISAGIEAGPPVASLLVGGGHHSWLYEHDTYRRTVARFLTEALGGVGEPAAAAERAASVDARRIPDPDEAFAAVTVGSGTRRTVAELVGAVRPAAVDELEAVVAPRTVSIGGRR
jgi:pimeloyl-ACP methyl ester carboxylesterase